MEMAGKSVFVAGADGGIGKALCSQLNALGAQVFQGALADVSGPSTVRLDVTDPSSVGAATAGLGPIDLVINATGIFHSPVDDAEEGIRLAQHEFEVNCFGMVRLARAFLPLLSQRRDARLVNLLSVAAWVALPSHASYAASKAAAWSYTNSLRLEFAKHGVGVTGVVLGYTDTGMTKHVEGPKNTADMIAHEILAGITRDDDEILCDERSRSVKSMLSDDIELIYRPLLTKIEEATR
jgi:NAD(P)-dependent dehydrogenase (short-subunit alcohol dehydrogenase family)